MTTVNQIIENLRKANEEGKIDFKNILLARRELARECNHKELKAEIKAELDHQEMLHKEIIAIQQIEAFRSIASQFSL